MKTNYQPPTAELIQAGTFFANLGLECPWVGEDAWCDLKAKLVQGELLMEYDHDEGKSGGRQVYCPPAVAAAVVWFAGELRAWCKRDTDIGTYDGVWYWRFGVFGTDYDDPDTVGGECATQLEAAVALILAVYKAMGGNNDT